MKRGVKGGIMIGLGFAGTVLVLAAAGCRVARKGGEKIQDLEYAILEEDEVPEEMAAEIEEEKTQPFWITYGDGENLYIGRGYGEQETGGYSIAVDSCYEDEEAVYIHTTLAGPPENGEEREEGEGSGCPYVAVKIAWTKKPVVFQGIP